MNYVKHTNMLGIDVKEIPCIVSNGAPTQDTEGAVGMMYMDSDTGNLYKCTAAGSTYTWVGLMDEVKAFIDEELLGGAW